MNTKTSSSLLSIFRLKSLIIGASWLSVVFISCNSSEENTTNIKPEQKLGHIVLQVSNLERSQRFYENILNMNTNEIASYNGTNRIFLSATNSHHELVLQEGLQEPIATKKRYLQQLAIEVKGNEQLAEYYDQLKNSNIPTKLVDNQVSWSIYLYDPDSVSIEIYWDVRQEAFGKQKVNGIQEDLSVEKLKNPYSK